jgi:hypothetical protein
MTGQDIMISDDEVKEVWHRAAIVSQDRAHVVREKMQDYLLSLYDNGTPTGEIMKAALDRAKDFAARNPATSTGNILILNMDHHDRTIIEVNELFYHREFKLTKWPFVLKYGIWVFDKGFVDHRRCDGGWQNWSMMGHFDKDGQRVTFFDRRLAGI